MMPMSDPAGISIGIVIKEHLLPFGSPLSSVITCCKMLLDKIVAGEISERKRSRISDSPDKTDDIPGRYG